jgi:hypothetical protein
LLTPRQGRKKSGDDSQTEDAMMQNTTPSFERSKISRDLLRTSFSSDSSNKKRGIALVLYERPAVCLSMASRRKW